MKGDHFKIICKDFFSYLAFQYGYKKLISLINTEFYECHTGKFYKTRNEFFRINFFTKRVYFIKITGKHQIKAISDNIWLNYSFARTQIEKNYPSVHFVNVSPSEQFLNYIDLSINSEILFDKSSQIKMWTDEGGKINLVFKHLLDLESTFSERISKGWYGKENSRKRFLSFKFLRN